MTLKLPLKFDRVLDKDDRLKGEVLRLTGDFSNWIYENNTDFFPEYTDHGERHIQSVLNTAEEIISKKSWDILTPEDVYVLVSSILLHDCAMHISLSGLWELLVNDRYNGVLLGYDKEEQWSKRWEEFEKEVSRFDESSWVSLFGEYATVSVPKINEKNINNNQKILIGDFVRKYHACIAQVISSYGIPVEGGPHEVFNSDFNYLNQLSGLVARSHNHDLRDVLDVLDGDRARVYRDTHPVYLMGVLRISDYLQIKEDRTPKILFKMKAFCSPVSIREWKKHLSILSCNTSYPDEELYFVESYPEDARTLVEVNKLLVGLQKELDGFWAVMGEVYSRYSNVGLNELGINIRRVRSNIDDPFSYVRCNHKNYYPEVLQVVSDNQKLLPLLIKPLYGDRPQIGLRELLQNSIDACNERYSLDLYGEVNTKDIPYNITVKIDMDKFNLIVKDEGVGMTADVVKNYFLKIGSSFRSSEMWKSMHVNKQAIFVPRTGKFGIGMLAGFLIGDEIKIESKSCRGNQSESIVFSYKVDSSDIQVMYSNNDNIGTTLTIKSDESRLKKLVDGLKEVTEWESYYRYEEDRVSSWWYFLDTPVIDVVIIENGQEEVIKNPYVLSKNNIFSKWQCVKDTELENYLWIRNKKSSFVYCNGVMIKGLKPPEVKISLSICYLEVGGFEVCVFDNHGVFPLNLTRDDLMINGFFEIEKFKKSFYMFYFKSIKQIIEGYDYSRKNIVDILGNYPVDDSRLVPLIFKRNEVVPFLNCDDLEPDENVFVDFLYSSQNRGVIYHDEMFKKIDSMPYSCLYDMEKQSNTLEFAMNCFILNKEHVSRWGASGEVSGLNLCGWVFVREYDYKKLSEYDINKYEGQGVVRAGVGKGWFVLSTSELIDEIPSEAISLISCVVEDVFIFSIYKSNKSESTEFSNLWNEFI